MLSAQQLSFFARNGFIQIPQLITADICTDLVSQTWSRLPESWKQDQPDTWSGVITDSCHSGDLKVRRGLLQFQKSANWGINDTILRGFGLDALCGQVAQQLIGAKLQKMHLRGLYCIAPLAQDIQYKKPIRPHIEAHPSQLIALCYLDDVSPNGGGLSVWPGSHREIYPCMGSKLEHVASDEYDSVFTKWASLAPVELPGARGDVVIIHHRLLHAPSLNRSSRIRFGFLCDYMRHDAKALCAERPTQSMWEDWPAIERLPAEFKDAPSDYPLIPLEVAPDIVPLHSRQYQLSVSHAVDADASTIRKADASALERSRREGDVWVLLSDNPQSANDWKLFPRGSSWSSSCMKLRINGQLVVSACEFDHISRFESGSGRHTIEISDLDRNAWIRVLRTRLPFASSEFVMQSELLPGRSVLHFEV